MAAVYPAQWTAVALNVNLLVPIGVERMAWIFPTWPFSTYHCEAHKLEVLAAVEIAAQRIAKMPQEYVDSLPDEKRNTLKQSIATVMDLYRNGI